jgi:hypothetical protein
MKRLALACLLAAACACISLTPKGAKVRVAEAESEVAGCASLGKVRPHDPYLLRAEAIKQMKNQTAEDGGDVLLLTTAGWTKGDYGTEYDCSGGKKQKE